MKIAISAESTCDLPKDLIKKYDFHIIPYKVILGNEVWTDDEELPERIFQFVESTKTLPKTSALNEMDYKEYFEGLLNSYDAVIHITLSSGITSSVSHAISAAEGMKNVFIVDSKSLSTGIALLMIYAKELADKNEKLRARVPYIQASFVIERLDYLAKGGRCSKLALFGANLLKIRPQILLEDGKMRPGKKYRGKMDKVVESYCKDTLEEFNTPDKKVAFITHTSATPEMIANAKIALENAGFEKIYDTIAGGTITSHCGEHVLGILYLNDGEQK